MKSQFTIVAFSPDSGSVAWNSVLPPISDMRLVMMGVEKLRADPFKNGLPDLAIFWICPQTIEALEAMNLAGTLDPHRAIMMAAGRSISYASALKFGRFGFDTLYDLNEDAAGFSEVILDRYATWRTHQNVIPVHRDITETLIGNHASIAQLRRMILKIAEKPSVTVLVRGETGTGKGVVAQAIHDFSSRKDRAFVDVNCTAIPETLVEAELFGHEKGAFTDAHRSRRGIFEIAHGGSLFLDEIGYLKPEIQVKLLKVLEEKKFRRVGGEQDLRVDCRIITGTSVNLDEAVKTGSFRADLFYRLNIFPIDVPALRHRGDDIILLANHFRDHFAREYGIPIAEFHPDACHYLKQHNWPGNVRELKHAVERAVILSDGQPIRASEFGTEIRDDDMLSRMESSVETSRKISLPFPENGRSMGEIEQDVIRRVLEFTGNNKSEAARLLQISRSRLLRNLEGHDSELDERGDAG